MDNPVTITLESGAERAFFFLLFAAPGLGRESSVGREKLLLPPLDFLTN